MTRGEFREEVTKRTLPLTVTDQLEDTRWLHGSG